MLLSALLLVAGAQAADSHLVWRAPNVTLLGGPSKDGAWLSYVDSGELALRDLRGQRTVRLTHAAGKEFGYFSVIAPDSKSIAYAWFNDQGFYDLRTTSTGGGEPRIVYRNEEAGFVQPCAWTPDGKQILTLLFRKDNISQIALVPAAGGAPTVLRSLNWVYPKRMDLSPDGRHIVYDSFATEDNGDRTIYLLTVDGSSEKKLVTDPGNHLFPLWTPDGKRILFASDRGDGMGLWQVDPAGGKSRLVAPNLGRFVPLGITSQGDYYYGLRSGGTDVYVSDPGGTQRRLATMKFPDRNRAPAWSPDGEWLAYLSRRGSENFGQESRVIVLRPARGGEEREVAPKLAHLESLTWSPDGKSLVVRGSDRQGRGGLYRVDTGTGVTKPLLWDEAAGFRGLEGAYLDGSLVYLLGNEIRTKESVLRTCVKARALAVNGSDAAALCGGRSIAILRGGTWSDVESPIPNPQELAWLGSGLAVGDGQQLRLLGGQQKINLPAERIPGISVHPNGKTIAYTAGSAQSEIWCLRITH